MRIRAIRVWLQLSSISAFQLFAGPALTPQRSTPPQPSTINPQLLCSGNRLLLQRAATATLRDREAGTRVSKVRIDTGMFCLLRNYGRGVSDVAAELRPLHADASAVKTMDYLRGDFANADAIGPSRAEGFLYGQPDAAIQADAAGFVRQLLAECKKRGHLLGFRSVVLQREYSLEERRNRDLRPRSMGGGPIPFVVEKDRKV